MSKRNDFSADYEMMDFIGYMQRANAIPPQMNKLGVDLQEVEKLIRASAEESGKFFKTSTRALVKLLQLGKPENISESLFLAKMAGVSKDVVGRYVDRFDPEKSIFSNLPAGGLNSHHGTDIIYYRFSDTARCLKDYQKDLDSQAMAKACVLKGKPVIFDFEYAKKAPDLLLPGMNYTVNARTITRNDGKFQPGWYNASFTDKVVDFYKSKSGLFMVEFADKIYVSDDISVHYYKAYKDHEYEMAESEKEKDPKFIETKTAVFKAMEDVSKMIDGLYRETQGHWLSQFGSIPFAPVDHSPDITDMYTFVGYTRELFDITTEQAKMTYRSEVDRYTHDIAGYVKNLYEACVASGIPIIHAGIGSTLSQSTVLLETREPGVPMEHVNFFRDQLPASGEKMMIPQGCKFAGQHAGCEEFIAGMECTVLESCGSGSEFVLLTDKGIITSCDMETIYQNLLLARDHEMQEAAIEQSNDGEILPGGRE